MRWRARFDRAQGRRRFLVLLSRRGNVVDKRELMDAVWPDANVEEAYLAQTMYVLRTFFKERPCGVTIENVPKRGYRLRVESPMVISSADHVRIYGIWRGVEWSIILDDVAASTSFDRALGLNPHEVNALVWQGTIFMNRGHIEAARALFARAVSLAPDVPGSLAFLAWSDFLLGDFGTARRSILELGRIRDTHVAAAALLARVDALTGHKRFALSDLHRVEATTDPASVGDWDAASIAAAYLAVDRAPGAYVWLARVSPGAATSDCARSAFRRTARRSAFYHLGSRLSVL